nr:hypothetical protein [uncultured Lachnoanaerobaculum sp.]
MRKKGLLLVLSMAISGVLTIPAFAGNWMSNGSIWEYYENGTKTSNRWIQSGDGKSWYYIKDNGSMASNEWIRYGYVWYFMKQDGTMAANQWLQSGNEWYFIKPDGIMAQSEWIDWNNDWYYVGATGSMVTNQNINGYEVGSDGKMITNSDTIQKTTTNNYDGSNTSVLSELTDGRGDENYNVINQSLEEYLNNISPYGIAGF